MKKWLQTAFTALFLALALAACGGGTPAPAPTPEPEPEPEPVPFMALRSGQAASIVIGQDDFVSDSEANPQKEFRSPYGNPLVVDGVLYLPDYGAGRVMGYLEVPTENGVAADFVLGKPDFFDSVSSTSATSFVGPQTLFTDGIDLYTIDYDDSRIVRYDGFPTISGAAAAFVIGQPNLNSWGSGCSATRFDSPESATIAGNRLIVADSGNNRVLIWNTIPTEFDTPADIVLGQLDMDSCAEPDDPTAQTLRDPADVWSDGTRLLVLDYAHERVLLWNTFPTSNAQAADVVLGQINMTEKERGDGAAELSSPYFLASNGTQIAVADSSNDRVVIWNEFPTENGTPADVVLGQIDFGYSDANGGASGPTSTGLDYPTGVLFYENSLIVTDNDNARYLIFEGF